MADPVARDLPRRPARVRALRVLAWVLLVPAALVFVVLGCLWGGTLVVSLRDNEAGLDLPGQLAAALTSVWPAAVTGVLAGLLAWWLARGSDAAGARPRRTGTGVLLFVVAALALAAGAGAAFLFLGEYGTRTGIAALGVRDGLLTASLVIVLGAVLALLGSAALRQPAGRVVAAGLVVLGLLGAAAGGALAVHKAYAEGFWTAPRCFDEAENKYTAEQREFAGEAQQALDELTHPGLFEVVFTVVNSSSGGCGGDLRALRTGAVCPSNPFADCGGVLLDDVLGIDEVAARYRPQLEARGWTVVADSPLTATRGALVFSLGDQGRGVRVLIAPA